MLLAISCCLLLLATFAGEILSGLVDLRLWAWSLLFKRFPNLIDLAIHAAGARDTPLQVLTFLVFIVFRSGPFLSTSLSEI